MTRITDFGRKRTYVEAGFASEPLPDSAPPASPSAPPPAPAAAPDESAEKPAKKKRKRTPKSKRDNYGKDKPAGADDDAAAAEPAATTPAEELSNRKLRKKEKTKEWRDRKNSAVAAVAAVATQSKRSASAPRWQPSRPTGRDTHTTCLACRQTGHKAKDCRASGGRTASVGICYRCGSTQHSLSKCPVPVDSSNPLPFASCFVCSGTGHLASGCPQNAARGIYPNGGGCKLCGKNTHLAKDCDVRRRGADPRGAGASFGGGEAGADEDDFHAERCQPAQTPRAVPVPPSNAKKRVVHF